MMAFELARMIELVYRPEEYPVLKWQADKWIDEQPLKGVRILDATPVFLNTFAKYIGLIAAGAELSVGISDVMTNDREMVGLLRELGVPVVKAEDGKREFDIILDCAASFSDSVARLGYVELTRSGVDGYAQSASPVFLADGGRIKRIETMLGTGESYFRAMRELGYNDWTDRQLVVMGSGKVGSGIIAYGHSMGARVTVITDPSTVSEWVKNHVAEIVDYRHKKRVAECILEAYAVVTATGVLHAMEHVVEPEILLASNALLANMGVEDEYGPSIPASAVLNNKIPLNFYLNEPTLLKYIDATMALHNAGSVWLATQKDVRSGLILPPPEMESELLEITRQHGLIGEELELI